MTDERWENLIGQIKDNFEVTNQRTEDLPPEAGPGTVEIIEFIGPLGQMKLERTTQPLVIDKRTIGSRRIGSETKVEYIYSDTEKVHKFAAYRFDSNDGIWVEMTLERGEMLF